MRPLLAHPLATLLPALSTLLLASCSSGTATTASGGGASTTSSGGSGGTGARTPLEHRAAEVSCTGERPPGGGGFGDPADHCATDADCTTGASGRCVAALGQPAFCSYDACAADADCGAVTACVCRNPASYNANTCVPGTCRLDADCGAGGFCSPSAVTIYANCLTGIEPGSVGHFCHQAADACVDDTDCGPSGSVCLFSVGEMRWVCHELVCTK